MVFLALLRLTQSENRTASDSERVPDASCVKRLIFFQSQIRKLALASPRYRSGFCNGIRLLVTPNHASVLRGYRAASGERMRRLIPNLSRRSLAGTDINSFFGKIISPIALVLSKMTVANDLANSRLAITCSPAYVKLLEVSSL